MWPHAPAGRVWERPLSLVNGAVHRSCQCAAAQLGTFDLPRYGGGGRG